jgi:hypothetical protein
MFDERFSYIQYDTHYSYDKDRHSNVIKKFLRHCVFYNKLPILWEIAEYYTKKKYHPVNILKYIKLD